MFVLKMNVYLFRNELLTFFKHFLIAFMFRLSLFKCTLLLFDAGFNSKNQITANKRQKRPSGQDSVYRGREWQGTTKP